MNHKWLAVAGALSLGLAVACASGEDEGAAGNSAPAARADEASASPQAQQAQQAQKVGLHPKHKPAASAMAKGKAPQPPAGAWNSNTVGEGELAVSTGNVSGDTDAVWAEEIDFDDDGHVEQTDLLYDEEDKVLYLFAEKSFSCADDRSEGGGGVLMAIYGQGNPRGEPAGSGWYLAALDAGECNARAAALWGCKFDAGGNRTACGLAEARAEDDIAILAPDASAVATGTSAGSQ